MATSNKLTPQQRMYADLLISGMKQGAAYQRAYPNQSLSPGALKVEASRTAANPKIVAYVEKALAQRRSEVLLTRDKKRQILGAIALDESAADTARIMAIKTDNEMTGDNAPVRVEGEITLNGIYQALVGATGLPSEEEQRFVKAKRVKELKDDDDDFDLPVETTAMERAGR